MYTFSKKSLERLSTCHSDLQLIASETIKITRIDFGISEGHRSLERQTELYNKGLSRIDGISKKGKHNHYPSMAFDFFACVPNRKDLAFDPEHLTWIGACLDTVAKVLYSNKEISHRLRWGGNWDGDGIILQDQKLWDRPHVELV